MSPDLCRLHYRTAVAGCTACGRGVCTDCRGTGDLCPFCTHRREEELAMARERRRSRIALRRAGIALHSEPGDPVILREGPFRLVVPMVGVALTAWAAAAVCAALERGLGLDSALAALLCAGIVGLCVRRLFGGVSRTGGVISAALCIATALAGGAWTGATGGGVVGPDGLRQVTAWVVAHGPVVPLIYAVAAAIAYAAAAGRRVA